MHFPPHGAHTQAIDWVLIVSASGTAIEVVVAADQLQLASLTGLYWLADLQDLTAATRGASGDCHVPVSYHESSTRWHTPPVVA